MRYLVYLGHPAHFHLFRNVIKILKGRSHEVLILIKKKDVLENLVKSTGWEYININQKGRADNKIAIAYALMKRDVQLLKACLKFKPNLMIGTSAEITHIGKLLGIYSIVVNEDDDFVVPLFAKLSYPLADKILAPNCCSVGRWENKKIGYNGYHEMAYLHPKYFTPDERVGRFLNKNREKYFILRFAKLSAHHDEGKTGITTIIADRIINMLCHYGNVYISSERELESKFEKYRIPIKAEEMHSALYFSDIYIGDSQTMAAEAAVLGTASVRFNDFVGQISYLEELEHKYQLTFGIKTSETEKLYQLINDLLRRQNLKEEWEKRRINMFSQTSDLTKLIVDLMENSKKKEETNYSMTLF
jgi:predicted glycosyltransferase